MQTHGNSLNTKFIRALGKIIRKHRLEQKKTMYKISAECSIHKSSWRLIEQGLVHDVKLTTLWKMAEGLDISPDILIKELVETMGEDFSLTDLK